MRNKKISASKNWFFSISLCCLCVLSFSCAGRKTKAPSYDYYYFQNQAIYRYHHQEQKHSLLLSIPPVYLVEKIKISPHKQHIAFSVFHEDRSVLFLWDIEGGNMRRVMEGDALTFEWSPNEDKLAIIQRQNDASFFYLTPHQLDTISLLAEADAFHWSPHGKYICLSKKSHASMDHSIIHHDGTGLRFIHSGSFLSWSEDGQHLYFTEPAPENTLFKAYHYSGTLLDERLFPVNSDFKIRNSSNEKRTLITYISEGIVRLEWYNPSASEWHPHENTLAQDYIRSHDPDQFWELQLSRSQGLQELHFESDEGLHVVAQGEQIHIASLSPNETGMICLVQNGSQQMIYVVNAPAKTWEFVASGEQVNEIIWHIDSSRVAIIFDQHTLMVFLGQNIMVTKSDNSLFLNWK